MVELREVASDLSETVVARFVWSGQGPVELEADDPEDREEFSQVAEQGIPDPEDSEGERVLTRADGLAFLRALAAAYRGSRFYATEPFQP